jgi:hypothetical protein
VLDMLSVQPVADRPFSSSNGDATGQILALLVVLLIHFQQFPHGLAPIPVEPGSVWPVV